MEEFFYISHELTDKDCDGRVILSYELMMEAEHQYRVKRGGGIGCRRPSPSSSNAPPCSQDTLEHVAWSEPDSKTLERLVWSVYDGVLSPGPTPKLTGPETYNQVTRWLATKVFWALQVCCPARTSAQFDEPSPVRKVRLVVFAQPPSKSARKADITDMTPPKREGAEEGAVGGDVEVDADPDIHPMAWMCNHQHCYDDEMISFWPLLCPLTDRGGTMMRHLACCLLSTWEWSSTKHPTSCPPAPTNMEIGRWLPLDRDNHEGSREDLWIEAYTCCLQCIAEASTRWSWVAEGEGMARVSPLTQAFLSATGRHISPAILRECWPPKHDIVPRQPMSETWARITHALTKWPRKALQTLLGIFSCDRTLIKTTGERRLPPPYIRFYCGFKFVMPGIWLVLHDKTGKYQGWPECWGTKGICWSMTHKQMV